MLSSMDRRRSPAKDDTILDVSWGQYAELRLGEIYKEKRKQVHFDTLSDSWWCNTCRRTLAMGTSLLGCRACDLDYCVDCEPGNAESGDAQSGGADRGMSIASEKPSEQAIKVILIKDQCPMCR